MVFLHQCYIDRRPLLLIQFEFGEARKIFGHMRVLLTQFRQLVSFAKRFVDRAPQLPHRFSVFPALLGDIPICAHNG